MSAVANAGWIRDDKLLPRHFDQVGLTKNCKDEIRTAGRNPDRKEADVLHGRPVNIYWCEGGQARDEVFDT